ELRRVLFPSPPARPRVGRLPRQHPQRRTPRLHRPRHHPRLRRRGRPVADHLRRLPRRPQFFRPQTRPTRRTRPAHHPARLPGLPGNLRRLLRQTLRGRTPCQRRSHRPRHLHRRRIRFHRLPRHRALHAQPRQTHRHLLGRRPTPRQKHRRSPRTHPRRSPRRPHHHRRIRPGLLARQTSRLLAQRHRLAHLHARVLRERRHPRASHPHLRRRQSLRHQGRHPRL